MKPVLLDLVLLVLLVTPACAGSQNTNKNTATGNVATSLSSTDDLRNRETSRRQLREQLAAVAAAAKGHVGVFAEVLETGESVSLNPQDHFPMQSVYKLPIGMALMKQVDAGKLKLDQRVRVTKSDFVRAGMYSPIRDRNPQGTELSIGDLLQASISTSDGTASDVLMKLVGGPEAVQAHLIDLKITDIVVLNSENEIGRDWQTQYRNWATPEAAVALLRTLQERRGLSESSQSLLLKLMTDSARGAKRLKGLLPAGTVVAHKTGTSGTQRGITAATNDIGIVAMPNGRHLAIAVFVSDSPAEEATRERVIAAVARVVWNKWSR